MPLAIRQLGLPMSAIEEQFRRMVFNIIARNQDDHVKNIAFLMDKAGKWWLSPALTITCVFFSVRYPYLRFRPGRAPVCSPVSTTSAPFTKTYSTPPQYVSGCSSVEPSSSAP